MHVTDERSGVSWGARINTRRGQKVDCPAWADRLQQETWEKQGLVLWDHQSREITRLAATQTLSLLSYMRSTDDWRQEGLVVGEPSVQVFPDDPKPNLMYTLAHEMTLSPEQAQGVFELPENNEAELQVMSRIEKSGYQQKQNQFLNLLAEILIHPPTETGIATGDSE